MISYVPGSSALMSSSLLSPAAMSAEAMSVPRTAKLCTIVPLLRTVSEPGVAIDDTDRSMANSERSASTASPAAAPPSSSAARRASPIPTMLTSATNTANARTSTVQPSRLTR